MLASGVGQAEEEEREGTPPSSPPAPTVPGTSFHWSQRPRSLPCLTWQGQCSLGEPRLTGWSPPGDLYIRPAGGGWNTGTGPRWAGRAQAVINVATEAYILYLISD